MSQRKKQIRKQFREAVFKRDAYTCKGCGKKFPLPQLDAHHITDRNEMPNGGYVLENGITLCDTPNGCHWKAEQYHISGGKTWIEGFHPNDLYALIQSSKEKAIKMSEQL